MRHTILAFALAGAAGAAFTPAPALAVTCYQLLDRNDNVVYQDIYPPVDLSDSGAAERQALRARGEHLVSMEVDRCPPLEFLTGGAGGTRLDFNQMVDLTTPRAMQAPPDKGATQSKRGAAATPAAAKPAATVKSAAPAKSADMQN